MEQDACWMTIFGNEMGGCCLSVSPRDYGRYALFFLDGAKSVVAPEWTKQATTATPFQKVGGDPVIAETVRRGGYGYQWWIGPGGTFFAAGVFGQHIQFFPAEKLIVVSRSAWAAGSSRIDNWLPDKGCFK
jgi:CubicO group peptidase (beta-lactamase class C family)